MRLAGSQYLVSSRSGTTVPKELDTRRRARDAIFLTGCTPSSYKLELGFTICISLTLSREVYCVVLTVATPTPLWSNKP